MTDKPLSGAPVIPLSEGASSNAPIIYFYGVPNFGTFNGIANMTLEAAIHFMDDNGKIGVKRAIVAHLRMGPHGLANLKSAVEGIELLAKPAEQGQPN